MIKPSKVDFEDVQGLVRFGYGKLTEASFLLLWIRDAAKAKMWLASAPVSSAVKAQVPEAALQVAFTCDGLRALGVAEDVLSGFSAEFCSGMAGDENRARRLADIGNNAPANWQWGGTARNPHLIVMLYARKNRLDNWLRTVQGPHWNSAFEVLACLPTSNLFGVEPFGFKDGVSQPAIDWEQRRQVEGDQLVYRNLTALGEFLLGYRNEYAQYTDRPLLPAADNANADLPIAEDKPGTLDLGRNGTYLVFRQLSQDVRGFWRFMDRQTHSDPKARQELAEALVGRKQNGDPLVELSRQPIEGVGGNDVALNQFTFDSDPGGLRCPLGAHIRRANPRTSDLPGACDDAFSKLRHKLGFTKEAFCEDVIASARFHRVLRRGREYGPALPVEEALQPGPPEDPERGIHFICLGASISRQFEFVQSAWVMSSKFAGLTDESDPLLGNGEAMPGCPVTNTFSIAQQNAAIRRIRNVPQFITVRGGAYFFLPGIRALKFLISG